MMKSKLCYSDRVHVAYALYGAGFKPYYSSNLGDFLTAGYGECDSGGDFEYPLWLHLDDSIAHIGAIEHLLEEFD